MLLAGIRIHDHVSIFYFINYLLLRCHSKEEDTKLKIIEFLEKNIIFPAFS
jgi:hypothetical protein